MSNVQIIFTNFLMFIIEDFISVYRIIKLKKINNIKEGEDGVAADKACSGCKK